MSRRRQLRSRSRTPSGPWTTTSESSREGALLVGGRADQQRRAGPRSRSVARRPRTPRRRRGRRRRTGSRRPRAPRPGLARRAPLCMPGERDLDHVAAGLDDQAVALGQLARAAAAAARTPRRGRRGGGCARRRPGPSPRRRRRPRRRRAAPGAARAGSVGQPVRRPRRDHPAVGRGPALVAVLPEHEELAAGVADRVADLVEPAEGQRLAGRAAGDHRDGAHRVGQVDQDARARRGGCGRTRGRRRSGPGCRRSRGRRRRRRRRATSAAYRCSPSVGGELHAPHPVARRRRRRRVRRRVERQA